MFNQTPEQKAEEIIRMFNGDLEKANHYVILWRDEYLDSQDKDFRNIVYTHIQNKL